MFHTKNTKRIKYLIKQQKVLNKKEVASVNSVATSFFILFKNF